VSPCSTIQVRLGSRHSVRSPPWRTSNSYPSTSSLMRTVSPTVAKRSASNRSTVVTGVRVWLECRPSPERSSLSVPSEEGLYARFGAQRHRVHLDGHIKAGLCTLQIAKQDLNVHSVWLNGDYGNVIRRSEECEEADVRSDITIIVVAFRASKKKPTSPRSASRRVDARIRSDGEPEWGLVGRTLRVASRTCLLTL
jgi:hypothetical protein